MCATRIDLVGQTIADTYQIVKQVNEGAMGVVFKGIDLPLGRDVAIKMLKFQEESLFKRFETEAKALSDFDCPNIVRVYAFCNTDIGSFIIMEYLEGGTLADKLKHGPLPPSKAITILKMILNAIGHAHQVPVIHRDIKPSNILFNKSDEVKVTDFGLAKREKGPDSTLTKGPIGTLYYMSPEQVRSISPVDRRSDIYSIGMTFYEMLTGNVPFEDSSDYAIRTAIVKGDIPFPHKAPRALAKIVMKCIEKDPISRYQSVDELKDDIEKYEESLPREPTYGKFWQKVAMAAGILSVAAVLVFGLLKLHETIGGRIESPARPLDIEMVQGGSVYVDSKWYRLEKGKTETVPAVSDGEDLVFEHQKYGRTSFKYKDSAGRFVFSFEQTLSVEAVDQNGRSLEAQFVLDNLRTAHKTPLRDYVLGPGTYEVWVYMPGYVTVSQPVILDIKPGAISSDGVLVDNPFRFFLRRTSLTRSY